MYIDTVTTLGIAFMFLCGACVYLNWRINQVNRHIVGLQTMFLDSLQAMQLLANSHKDMLRIMENITKAEVASDKATYDKLMSQLKDSINKYNKEQSVH